LKRYKRREISVEDALVEIYLAGVSVRRGEEITQAVWSFPISPPTRSSAPQFA
jgi:transposase-like protein